MDYHETADAIAALVSQLPAPSAWDELEAFAREPVRDPLTRFVLMWKAMGDWIVERQREGAMEGELRQRCEQLLDLLPYERRHNDGSYMPDVPLSWPYVRHLDFQSGAKRKITRNRRELIASSTHLRSLGYKASDLLKEEAFIWGLQHLERLEITNTRQTRALELTQTYDHITQLAIPYTGLRSFEVLRRFPNLTSLTITDSKHLTDLSEFAQLTSLRHLSLRQCTGFESLEPLGELDLVSLDLYECRGLTEHETLGRFENLERLVTNNCQFALEARPKDVVLFRREDVAEYQESVRA